MKKKPTHEEVVEALSEKLKEKKKRGRKLGTRKCIVCGKMMYDTKSWHTHPEIFSGQGSTFTPWPPTTPDIDVPKLRKAKEDKDNSWILILLGVLIISVYAYITTW